MAKEGRPTAYKEQFIDKVDEYLASSKDEEYQVRSFESGRGVAWNTKIRVHLPTIEGFAQFIGVPRRTVFDWKDVHPEFSHSLEKILTEQQKRLIDSGLAGDYSPTIAKLILSANHGMREKTDLTSDGKAIPSPIYGGKSDPDKA